MTPTLPTSLADRCMMNSKVGAMVRHTWGVTVVSVLTLAACAVQPDETNLRASFADQIASSAGVQAFERNGDELTFSGPDGRGGTVGWRVLIESTELKPGPDERLPYEGHIVSTWWRDGELIEPLGTMSGLPVELQDRGIAQVCYALWDAELNAWGWT